MINEEMMRFYHECEEAILSDLPEEFEGMTFELKEFPKNNIVRTGIIAKNCDGNVAPTVYIDQIFEKYQRNGDMQEAITTITDLILEGYKNMPLVEVDNISQTNDIIPCLINTKTNQDMLSKVPHIELHDLSIYFRGVVSVDDKGFATFIINNDIARIRGLDANDLLEIANAYVEKNMEYKASGIMELLFDSPPEEEELMYVITNDKKMFGASAMLNAPLLESVMDEKFHTDKLMIIPSSIHECIVVDGNSSDARQIQEIVTEVNSTQVAPEEVLSASVYSYKKEEGLQVAVQKDLTEKEISNDKEMKSPVMDM